ncbi:hypothetical protein ABEF95_001369 [Exophiala dermatitidis]|uniref:Uncharacterized protein n=1 Tax=Exophiala dermatitidis (strain ATCC 34100 / CBS 525.76 / NIH/UT8656) TaxID=858893 RepID=H6BZ02_EXODN|nr:uncharacterized protein HMPREF1120_04929 [Exophiala dermatitidis NIH/UT8656]EHY56865.1 hypothetical protein HMPREF1120_04929 [Exophiala dermatitidis NIH/UT8656]
MVKPDPESNNSKVWIPITIVACILSVILVAWCVCRCSRDEDDHDRGWGGRGRGRIPNPPLDWFAVAPPRRPRGGPGPDGPRRRRRPPFNLPPGAAAVAAIGAPRVRGLPMPLPWQEVVFAAEYPIMRQRAQQQWEVAPEPRLDIPMPRQPEPLVLVREPRGAVMQGVRRDGQPRVFMDNRDLERDAAADPLMDWRFAEGLGAGPYRHALGFAPGQGLGMMGPVAIGPQHANRRRSRRRRVRFDPHPHWIEERRPDFDHDDDEGDDDDGGVGVRANIIERRPIFD